MTLRSGKVTLPTATELFIELLDSLTRLRPCSICGSCPCETPGACKGDAEKEAQENQKDD